MKIKPLFDRIIVEEESEETSKGGIYLGKTNKGIKIGKVLSVGDGNEKNDGSLSKMLVKEGDRVVFSQFTCAEATILGKSVLVLRQTDILAIIEK